MSSLGGRCLLRARCTFRPVDMRCKGWKDVMLLADAITRNEMHNVNQEMFVPQQMSGGYRICSSSFELCLMHVDLL